MELARLVAQADTVEKIDMEDLLAVDNERKSYTQEENYRAYKLFSMMDVDHGGSISLREINRMLLGDIDKYLACRFDHPDTGIIWGLDSEKCVIISSIEENSEASKLPYLIKNMKLVKINDLTIQKGNSKSLQLVFQQLLKLSDESVNLEFLEPILIINKFSCKLDLEADNQVFTITLPIGPNVKLSCRFALGFSSVDLPSDYTHAGQPLLIDLNLGLSEANLAILMNELFIKFDEDGSGEFEFEEFRDFYVKFLDTEESLQRLKAYANYRFRDIQLEEVVKVIKEERTQKMARRNYLAVKNKELLENQRNRFHNNKYFDQFGIPRRYKPSVVDGLTRMKQEEDEQRERENPTQKKTKKSKKSDNIDDNNVIISSFPEVINTHPDESGSVVSNLIDPKLSFSHSEDDNINITTNNINNNNSINQKQILAHEKHTLKKLKAKERIRQQNAKHDYILQKLIEANSKIKKSEFRSLTQMKSTKSQQTLEIQSSIKDGILKSFKEITMNENDYPHIKKIQFDIRSIIAAPGFNVNSAVLSNKNITNRNIEITELHSSRVHPAGTNYYFMYHPFQRKNLDSLEWDAEKKHITFFNSDYVRQPSRHSSHAVTLCQILLKDKLNGIEYRKKYDLERVTEVPPEESLVYFRKMKAEEEEKALEAQGIFKTKPKPSFGKVKFLDEEEAKKSIPIDPSVVARVTVLTIMLSGLSQFNILEKNSPFVNFQCGKYKFTSEVNSFAGRNSQWDDLEWSFHLRKSDSLAFKILSGTVVKNIFGGECTISSEAFLNLQIDHDGIINMGLDIINPTTGKVCGKLKGLFFVELGQEWDWFVLDYKKKEKIKSMKKEQMKHLSRTLPFDERSQYGLYKLTSEFDETNPLNSLFPFQIIFNSILLFDTKSIHFLVSLQPNIILTCGNIINKTTTKTQPSDKLANSYLYKNLQWKTSIMNPNNNLIFLVYSRNVLLGRFAISGLELVNLSRSNNGDVDIFGQLTIENNQNKLKEVTGKLKICCNLDVEASMVDIRQVNNQIIQLNPFQNKKKQLSNQDEDVMSLNNSTIISNQQFDNILSNLPGRVRLINIELIDLFNININNTILSKLSVSTKCGDFMNLTNEINYSSEIIDSTFLLQKNHNDTMINDQEQMIGDSAVDMRISATSAVALKNDKLISTNIITPNKWINLNYIFPIKFKMNIILKVFLNKQEIGEVIIKASELVEHSTDYHHHAILLKDIYNGNIVIGRIKIIIQLDHQGDVEFIQELFKKLKNESIANAANKSKLMSGYSTFQYHVDPLTLKHHVADIKTEQNVINMTYNPNHSSSIISPDNARNEDMIMSSSLLSPSFIQSEQSSAKDYQNKSIFSGNKSAPLKSPNSNNQIISPYPFRVIITDIIASDLKSMHMLVKNSPHVSIACGLSGSSTPTVMNGGSAAIWSGLNFMFYLYSNNNTLRLTVWSKSTPIGFIIIEPNDLLACPSDQTNNRELFITIRSETIDKTEQDNTSLSGILSNTNNSLNINSVIQSQPNITGKVKLSFLIEKFDLNSNATIVETGITGQQKTQIMAPIVLTVYTITIANTRAVHRFSKNSPYIKAICNNNEESNKNQKYYTRELDYVGNDGKWEELNWNIVLLENDSTLQLVVLSSSIVVGMIVFSVSKLTSQLSDSRGIYEIEGKLELLDENDKKNGLRNMITVDGIIRMTYTFEVYVDEIDLLKDIDDDSDEDEESDNNNDNVSETLLSINQDPAITTMEEIESPRMKNSNDKTNKLKRLELMEQSSSNNSLYKLKIFTIRLFELKQVHVMASNSPYMKFKCGDQKAFTKTINFSGSQANWIDLSLQFRIAEGTSLFITVQSQQTIIGIIEISLSDIISAIPDNRGYCQFQHVIKYDQRITGKICIKYKLSLLEKENYIHLRPDSPRILYKLKPPFVVSFHKVDITNIKEDIIDNMLLSVSKLMISYDPIESNVTNNNINYSNNNSYYDNNFQMNDHISWRNIDWTHIITNVSKNIELKLLCEEYVIGIMIISPAQLLVQPVNKNDGIVIITGSLIADDLLPIAEIKVQLILSSYETPKSTIINYSNHIDSSTQLINGIDLNSINSNSNNNDNDDNESNKLLFGFMRIISMEVSDLTQVYGLFRNSPKVTVTHQKNITTIKNGTNKKLFATDVAIEAGDHHRWDNLGWDRMPLSEDDIFEVKVTSGNEIIGYCEFLSSELQQLIQENNEGIDESLFIGKELLDGNVVNNQPENTENISVQSKKTDDNNNYNSNIILNTHFLPNHNINISSELSNTTATPTVSHISVYGISVYDLKAVNYLINNSPQVKMICGIWKTESGIASFAGSSANWIVKNKSNWSFDMIGNTFLKEHTSLNNDPQLNMNFKSSISTFPMIIKIMSLSAIGISPLHKFSKNSLYFELNSLKDGKKMTQPQIKSGQYAIWEDLNWIIGLENKNDSFGLKLCSNDIIAGNIIITCEEIMNSPKSTQGIIELIKIIYSPNTNNEIGKIIIILSIDSALLSHNQQVFVSSIKEIFDRDKVYEKRLGTIDVQMISVKEISVIYPHLYIEAQVATSWSGVTNKTHNVNSYALWGNLNDWTEISLFERSYFIIYLKSDSTILCSCSIKAYDIVHTPVDTDGLIVLYNELFDGIICKGKISIVCKLTVLDPEIKPIIIHPNGMILHKNTVDKVTSSSINQYDWKKTTIQNILLEELRSVHKKGKNSPLVKFEVNDRKFQSNSVPYGGRVGKWDNLHWKFDLNRDNKLKFTITSGSVIIGMVSFNSNDIIDIDKSLTGDVEVEKEIIHNTHGLSGKMKILFTFDILNGSTDKHQHYVDNTEDDISILENTGSIYAPTRIHTPNARYYETLSNRNNIKMNKSNIENDPLQEKDDHSILLYDKKVQIISNLDINDKNNQPLSSRSIQSNDRRPKTSRGDEVMTPSPSRIISKESSPISQVPRLPIEKTSSKHYNEKEILSSNIQQALHDDPTITPHSQSYSLSESQSHTPDHNSSLFNSSESISSQRRSITSSSLPYSDSIITSNTHNDVSHSIASHYNSDNHSHTHAQGSDDQSYLDNNSSTSLQTSLFLSETDTNSYSSKSVPYSDNYSQSKSQSHSLYDGSFDSNSYHYSNNKHDFDSYDMTSESWYSYDTSRSRSSRYSDTSDDLPLDKSNLPNKIIQNEEGSIRLGQSNKINHEVEDGSSLMDINSGIFSGNNPKINNHAIIDINDNTSQSNAIVNTSRSNQSNDSYYSGSDWSDSRYSYSQNSNRSSSSYYYTPREGVDEHHTARSEASSYYSTSSGFYSQRSENEFKQTQHNIDDSNLNHNGNVNGNKNIQFNIDHLKWISDDYTIEYAARFVANEFISLLLMNTVNSFVALENGDDFIPTKLIGAYDLSYLHYKNKEDFIERYSIWTTKRIIQKGATNAMYKLLGQTKPVMNHDINMSRRQGVRLEYVENNNEKHENELRLMKELKRHNKIPVKAKLTIHDLLGLDLSCIPLEIMPIRPYMTACKPYGNWAAETPIIKKDLNKDTSFALDWYGLHMKYKWESFQLRVGNMIIFDIHDANSGLVVAKTSITYEEIMHTDRDEHNIATVYLLFKIANEYGGGTLGAVVRIHIDLSINVFVRPLKTDDYWNTFRRQHWCDYPLPPISIGVVRQRFKEIAKEYDQQEIIHPSFFGFRIRWRGNIQDESRFIHPLFYGFSLFKQEQSSKQKALLKQSMLSHVPSKKLNPFRWDPAEKVNGKCPICVDGVSGCPRCFMMPIHSNGVPYRPEEFGYDPIKEKQEAIAKEMEMIANAAKLNRPKSGKNMNNINNELIKNDDKSIDTNTVDVTIESSEIDENDSNDASQNQSESIVKIHTNLTTYKSLKMYRTVKQSFITTYVKVMPSGYVRKLYIEAHQTIYQIYHMFRSHSHDGNAHTCMLLLPTSNGYFELHPQIIHESDLLLPDYRGRDPFSRYIYSNNITNPIINKFNKLKNNKNYNNNNNNNNNDISQIKNGKLVLLYFVNYKPLNVASTVSKFFSANTKFDLSLLPVYSAELQLFPKNIYNDNLQQNFLPLIETKYNYQQKDFSNQLKDINKQHKNDMNELIDKKRKERELYKKEYDKAMKAATLRIESQLKGLTGKDKLKALKQLRKREKQKQRSLLNNQWKGPMGQENLSDSGSGSGARSSDRSRRSSRSSVRSDTSRSNKSRSMTPRGNDNNDDYSNSQSYYSTDSKDGSYNSYYSNDNSSSFHYLDDNSNNELSTSNYSENSIMSTSYSHYHDASSQSYSQSSVSSQSRSFYSMPVSIISSSKYTDNSNDDNSQTVSSTHTSVNDKYSTGTYDSTVKVIDKRFRRHSDNSLPSKISFIKVVNSINNRPVSSSSLESMTPSVITFYSGYNNNKHDKNNNKNNNGRSDGDNNKPPLHNNHNIPPLSHNSSFYSYYSTSDLDSQGESLGHSSIVSGGSKKYDNNSLSQWSSNNQSFASSVSSQSQSMNESRSRSLVYQSDDYSSSQTNSNGNSNGKSYFSSQSVPSLEEQSSVYYDNNSNNSLSTGSYSDNSNSYQSSYPIKYQGYRNHDSAHDSHDKENSRRMSVSSDDSFIIYDDDGSSKSSLFANDLYSKEEVSSSYHQNNESKFVKKRRDLFRRDSSASNKSILSVSSVSSGQSMYIDQDDDDNNYNYDDNYSEDDDNYSESQSNYDYSNSHNGSHSNNDYSSTDQSKSYDINQP
eukprot:gene5825-8032_t